VTRASPQRRRAALTLPASDLEYVLAGGDASLAELAGRRLLVTGGAGFFGTWLLECLAFANQETDLGCDVTALVLPRDVSSLAARYPDGLPGVRFVAADVCALDPAAWAAQLGRPGHFDAVIHAAIHVDAATLARNPIPTLDTAVDGTRRVLDLARASGARRFLFLSSGAVYGVQPPELPCIPEDFRGAPDCASADAVYAEGKRIGETMCACYHRTYGLETVLARCFAFVGPHLPLDRHFAIGNFLRDALAGGPVIVQGDGTPMRSYMHAADLTVWLLALLTRGSAGRAYNVGASRAVSIAEAARIVAATAGPGIKVDVRGTPTPGAPPPRYIPCVRRAGDELGLREGLSLEDAVERTVRWLRGRR
jgi:nucleoside-diphosphate-sugar epimerase